MASSKFNMERVDRNKKIVPQVKPTPRNFEEMDEPKLNSKEKKWKGVDREIAVCLRKCEAYPGSGAYKWIQMEDIEYWFQQPEQTIVLGQEQKLDADMSSCISAMDFHLVWRNSDYCLSKLLRRWMHGAIKDNDPRFPAIMSVDDVEDGQFMAVLYIRDGRYYRCQVLHRVLSSYARYCVHLLDDGTILEVEIDRLRHLPVELHPSNCRPLAFRCQISGLEKYNESVQKKVVYSFVKTLNITTRVKVVIQDIDKISGNRLVALWDWEETKYINDLVLRAASKYAARSTPELDFSAKQRANDVALVMHMNYEIQIQNYEHIRLKGLRNWRITDVRSPSQFYMEYVYDDDEKHTPNWQMEMQKFYNDPVVREPYRRITSRVYKRRHYVWWYSETKKWERVRVLDSDLTSQTALVYLVDLGTTDTAGYDDLWELKKNFSTFSARAFKTFLADVAPVDSNAWSEESIDAFKYLVMGNDKIFHGVVVHRDVVENPIGGVGEETMELGVILIEKNAKVSYTVQAALAFFGLAQSTGLSSSRTDIFDFEGFGLQGNFSFADFKAYQDANAEETDENKMGTAALEKERLEMLHQNALTVCEPPVSLNDHELSDCYHLYSLAPADNTGWTMPKQVQVMLPQVKLVSIINPGCMYVQMNTKTEQVQQMMTAIGEIVGNEQPVNENDIGVGDFVAVFHQMELNSNAYWYRACVHQIMESLNLVKLILIDVGVELLSHFAIIRHLPAYFKTVPGYAYRIHLDTPNLMPVGGISWSAACAANFPKYILSWDAVNPSYFVWRSATSSVLKADVIHQPVIYSRSTFMWSLQPPTAKELEDPLNPLRDHPCLFNLFHSHGVNLEFEVQTDDNQGYRVQRLADLLVNMDFGIFNSLSSPV